jgi:PAS domain S-box-containing protein
MFLERQTFNSRAGQQLWPLPTLVIPSALASCLIFSQLFGAALIAVVIVLLVAQILFSLVVWTSWRGTREQLTGVRHELSSLQGIVDVLARRDYRCNDRRRDHELESRRARDLWIQPRRKLSARRSRCSSITVAARKLRLLFEKVARGENVTQHEMVHLKKGRTPIDVSLTICPIMDGKAITGASVVARDITERKRAAGSLAQQAAAMKASMDGMAIIDHLGVCIYLNDAYAKIFGYSDPERLIGASWEMFYFRGRAESLKEQIMPAVWRDGSWRGEAMGLKLSGGTFPLEISISSVDGGGLVQVVRDITERKKLEETLRNSSLKDDLTGLFNRRGLLKQAAPYFDFARRQKETCCCSSSTSTA